MRERSQLWIFSMCLMTLIIHLCSSSTHAQSPPESTAEPSQALTTEYQYAVKFVCSMLLPHQDGSLAQGIYRTVANVHNPMDEKISFAYKAVLAGRFGDEPISFSPTPFRGVTLHGDDAAEFDCFNFANLFCPTPEGFRVDFAFIDGFLVIRSSVELDVVDIYTARHREGDVETMEVDHILPRKLQTRVRITEKPKDQDINV